MPVLSAHAFGARAKPVLILPPGTTGAPYRPGVDLRVSVVPSAAKAEGVALPDQFVVVAHVPKPDHDGAEPAWERVVLTPSSPRRVGYHGEIEVDDFHAENIPVDAAQAAMIGVWFSVETPPHVTVTQRPGFLGIDSTPGDVVAWGQSWGENARAG
jgi:hypothetical protein